MTSIIVLAAFFADLSIRIVFDLGGWSPDLLLLSILYLSLICPLGEAYTLAFLAGLCWDAAFMDVMGTHAFLFVLAAMLAIKMRMVFGAHYAVSRLVMGILIGAMVRFGEVIIWLSHLDSEIPVSMPRQYILAGSIVTGVIFSLLPWRTRPVRLPSRSPMTVFSDRM